MQKITMVIKDNGDGSNGIQWVLDEAVLDKMQELADDGDECYASGDGLQTTELYFPEGFDLQNWIKLNRIYLTTLEDMEDCNY